MNSPDNDLLERKSHFAFGDNWLDFAEKIDEARIGHAVNELRRLSGADLNGRTFLDVGCGSGLHALAAVRLGASRVVGIDLDPESVEAARTTLRNFAPDSNVRFEVMSVFDLEPDTFGQFDVVYSWGVLHHTGDMYRAIRASTALVSGDGQFQVALYKATPFCGLWRGIKRWYSRSSDSRQLRARRVYKALAKTAMQLRGVDFERFVRDYAQRRGMNYDNDVHDWLGGFPYESISPQECISFTESLGFRLQRSFIVAPGRYLPGLLGTVCDEYVFVRGLPKSD